MKRFKTFGKIVASAAGLFGVAALTATAMAAPHGFPKPVGLPAFHHSPIVHNVVCRTVRMPSDPVFRHGHWIIPRVYVRHFCHVVNRLPSGIPCSPEVFLPQVKVISSQFSAEDSGRRCPGRGYRKITKIQTPNVSTDTSKVA